VSKTKATVDSLSEAFEKNRQFKARIEAMTIAELKKQKRDEERAARLRCPTCGQRRVA
jgi:hypothetical protein